MRLIGVGMGPGDPDLVTVKAARLLRDADRVFVPVLDPGEAGRAETTARAHLTHDRFERLVFALNERQDAARRERYWDAAGHRVAGWLREHGGTAVFATIGDPNVYSTFGYLAQTVRDLVPQVTVETVPGITAMQDLAARSRTVLCEGDETVALVPVLGDTGAVLVGLRECDTTVFYKCGRHLGLVTELIRSQGRLGEAVFGAALGLPGEQVRPLAEVEVGQAPYLSTVIVPPRRTTRGGRL